MNAFEVVKVCVQSLFNCGVAAAAVITPYPFISIVFPSTLTPPKVPPEPVPAIGKSYVLLITLPTILILVPAVNLSDKLL
jgi:hypothetical protein